MKLAAVMMSLLLLVGCSSKNTQSLSTIQQSNQLVHTTKSTIQVKEEDYYTDWTKGQYEEIRLGNESVTITKAGTYVLSGELSNGQIIVDADSKDTVRLVLNGVKITSKDNAPIYIENADKVILSLEEGTENILVDSASNNEAQDAVIYAKDDLTINGKGMLSIEANNKHGISCNNEFIMMDGTVYILAIGDGIHIKEDTLIHSGNLTIDAQQDAIQSDLNLEILDGTFNLTSGGGSENGPTHTESFGGPPIPKGEENFVPEDRPELPEEALTGGERPELPPEALEGGERPELPPEALEGEKRPELPPEAKKQIESTQETTESNAETTTISNKAIKAGENLIIQGGTFKINAADDALHSNGTMMIDNGTFTIKTGDDGIHSESELTINGGTITIEQSYEGLESAKIVINDGKINIKSSDDGINATEGKTEAMQEEMHFGQQGNAELIINGGDIYVDAQGDGLDANGTITMNGGTVYVDGPTNGGNGALDYDKSFEVTNGVLIASGSIQMAQSISDSSAQNALDISFSTTQQPGKKLEILDKNGISLLSYTPSKTFQNVIISSPLLKTGETYTYCYDNECIAEFTISEKQTYLDENGITTKRTNERTQRINKNKPNKA